MQNGKQKVIVIVGPTAVGKTAVAVQLAHKLRGEVISADSRQVYRGLDIGTGKITKKEMRGVPHHLLDVVSPKSRFTAADYAALAREKISEIVSRGNIPIIVGGSGHYIDAALGRVFIPEVPPDAALRRRLGKKTAEELFAKLCALDPRRAKTIDQYNPRRLIRAIEIAKALGRVPPHSDVLKNIRTIEGIFIGLTLPPDELKKKIDKRLSARMRKGMVEEARRLHAGGLSWKRMDELGLEYRALARYLRGQTSKVEMLRTLQTEIWHYAKRQMTWFNKNKDIRWFHPADINAIVGASKTLVINPSRRLHIRGKPRAPACAMRVMAGR